MCPNFPLIKNGVTSTRSFLLEPIGYLNRLGKVHSGKLGYWNSFELDQAEDGLLGVVCEPRIDCTMVVGILEV